MPSIEISPAVHCLVFKISSGDTDVINIPNWMWETTQARLAALKGFLAASPLKHIQ